MKPLRIGFTGTREGMSLRQRKAFAKFLSQVRIQEFHHGDCKGADANAHNIIMAIFGSHADIHVHPPNEKSMRAFCSGTIYRAKPYLDRNRDIVNRTEILIATPFDSIEKLRSGTWSTIRYAKKIGRPVYIIFPDGKKQIFNSAKRK